MSGTGVIIGLLALVCLVPFNFMPGAVVTVHGAAVPLHFFIFLPIGLGLLVWSLRAFARERRIPPFFLWALAVVATAVISSFVGGDAKDGLSAAAGLCLRAVALGAFSFLIVREEGDQGLRTGLALLGAVVAFAAIWEPFSGHYFLFKRNITALQEGGELWEPFRRVAVGAIGQPLPLAVLLNLFFPFSLSEWWRRRGWAWFVPVVLILTGIFLTYRRSGYAMALVTVVFFGARWRANRTVVLSLAACALVLFTAVLAVPASRKRFLERFDPALTAHEMRTSHRTQVYATVASVVKRHPLLGLGTRQYHVHFLEYATYPRPIGTPDNQYLLFLAEGGLVGFATFCAFLLTVLGGLWRHRVGGEDFFISAAGFAGLMLLIDGLYWPAAAMTFFVIIGAGLGRWERKEQAR